jgi:hypothetical protein
METSPLPPYECDAADLALAYALWDSENTTWMAADRINEYVDRARSVRHWLRVHRHDVLKLECP